MQEASVRGATVRSSPCPTASLNATVRSSVAPGDQFSMQAPDALPISDPEFAARRSRTTKSSDLAGPLQLLFLAKEPDCWRCLSGLTRKARDCGPVMSAWPRPSLTRALAVPVTGASALWCCSTGRPSRKTHLARVNMTSCSSPVTICVWGTVHGNEPAGGGRCSGSAGLFRVGRIRVSRSLCDTPLGGSRAEEKLARSFICARS